MKIKRPSPSLVISIIALVVACGGTATAASILVKNSSQIRNGAIQGVDIASGAVGDRQIKKDSIGTDKLKSTVRNTLRSQGLTAVEASRRAGPDSANGAVKTVATLQQLQPGTYAIFAKTTLGPLTTDQGLLGELLQRRQGSGHCILDAAGDVDDARESIAEPGSIHPSTLNLQITRSFDKPSDIKLNCESGIPWKTADTSILAVKLQGSSRVDVTG